jgi:methylamine dehydrogenase accessory protein MauD
VITALVVSNVVLWIAVVALTGVVAALARQLGVLHERTAPVGALVTGRELRAGDAAPVVEVEDLAGRRHALGAARADGRATLVFFLSPTCPVCKTLLPAVRSLARRERGWLDVVLASDGARAEHEAFVAAERLGEFPYVLSTPLGLAYRVPRLPHAALVDARGVLRAQGLVNTREHLESLLEAHERGVASIQDWLAREPEVAQR